MRPRPACRTRPARPPAPPPPPHRARPAQARRPARAGTARARPGPPGRVGASASASRTRSSPVHGALPRPDHRGRRGRRDRPHRRGRLPPGYGTGLCVLSGVRPGADAGTARRRRARSRGTSRTTWAASTWRPASRSSTRTARPRRATTTTPRARDPIAPRLYGPTDATVPEGWIHNLEHGALVLLYRGDSDGRDAGRPGRRCSAFYDSFPNSPVCNIQPGTIQGPVIARFDDMKTPFAALVWDRVLPLQIARHQGHPRVLQRTGANGRTRSRSVPRPSPSAAPSTSAAPSSAVPSASAAPSATPLPSTSPSPRRARPRRLRGLPSPS